LKRDEESDVGVYDSFDQAGQVSIADEYEYDYKAGPPKLRQAL